VTIGTHELDWGDQDEDGEFVVPDSGEDFDDDASREEEAALARDE